MNLDHTHKAEDKEEEEEDSEEDDDSAEDDDDADKDKIDIDAADEKLEVSERGGNARCSAPRDCANESSGGMSGSDGKERNIRSPSSP